MFHIAFPDDLNLQACVCLIIELQWVFFNFTCTFEQLCLNWITILMHVAWNGNKFDQLFILSRAYCFPFYTPQTSLKISPTKLHRPPSCNKSWRRRQSKCSETWIEDNFFSEPWLHARRMSIRIKTQRQPLKIYSKIISIFFAQSLY